MAGDSITSTGSSPSASSSLQFQPGSLSSSASSPPVAGTKFPHLSQQAMAAEAFTSPTGTQSSLAFSHSYPFSQRGDMTAIDRTAAGLQFLNGHDKPVASFVANPMPAIFMRRLSKNASDEALRSMFLFAKDFVDAEFVPAEYPEDKGFLSAIARFKTLAGALEARSMLDGRPNSSNEANMIVEVLQSPVGGVGAGAGGAAAGRRNTIEGASTRQTSSSASSTGSTGGQNVRQSSRYNGTFQAMEKFSPPTAALGGSAGLSNGELPVPDSSAHFQSLFSPQSPIGSALNDRPRVTGKSVINDDSVDEETGELLKDPVAYAKSGASAALPRRTTNPQIPLASRFGGLSLSTNNIASPPVSSFTTPRSGQAPVVSPTGLSGLGPNANYQLATQHYPRHTYPPVNPADQNPPCNTLYVGNLPIDTSEDELKAIFSKQRGYKRLCFRTKQNGPMCFVEFEDVSFATKALNELYGQPLHNSVKGGIRLSFSKNPLGVRSNQNTGMGPPTPMSPPGSVSSGMNGVAGMSSMPFSTASGPPPGLAVPPGLATAMNNVSSMGNPLGAPPMSLDSTARNSSFSAPGAGTYRGSSFSGAAAKDGSATAIGGSGRAFQDYMMGR
ncbi:hypothetical protein L228DRAFT_238867 [Xylona heveae TC161]|uniref:RRM domain-containing protein n=1 Tax=Xylona heveae (strain CBS 132557 / TC161) TaxID=1328760 RepID=A0A161TBC9_XYLHT|nr:hypothetical protein L228DRAFT_238867 [Xylona heveae TC161]KZF22977.1 hypothetical protein L228DRAFT_238867 [Xylona heveae TC161]